MPESIPKEIRTNTPLRHTRITIAYCILFAGKLAGLSESAYNPNIAICSPIIGIRTLRCVALGRVRSLGEEQAHFVLLIESAGETCFFRRIGVGSLQNRDISIYPSKRKEKKFGSCIY